MLCVMAAIVYYGWPIIEAILVILPIPDPKDIKSLLAAWMRGLKVKLSTITNLLTKQT
jgi:hypothetical protein